MAANYLNPKSFIMLGIPPHLVDRKLGSLLKRIDSYCIFKFFWSIGELGILTSKCSINIKCYNETRSQRICLQQIQFISEMCSTFKKCPKTFSNTLLKFGKWGGGQCFEYSKRFWCFSTTNSSPMIFRNYWRTDLFLLQ